MNTRFSHSGFCNLHKALKTPKEIVNVIVFGGSVTSGRYTQGCCSKPECDGVHTLEVFKRCAWAQYFGDWLNSTFDADVRTHNLAQGGMASGGTWNNCVLFFYYSYHYI